jgi:hypothetical protein
MKVNLFFVNRGRRSPRRPSIGVAIPATFRAKPDRIIPILARPIILKLKKISLILSKKIGPRFFTAKRRSKNRPRFRRWTSERQR